MKKDNTLELQRMNRISRIISPHRFEEDDTHGKNDIKKMLVQPGWNPNDWPECKPVLFLSNDDTPFYTFYETKLRQMEDAYFAHAYRTHHYKTYEQLRELPYFSIQENWSEKKEPEDKQIAEQYGIGIFLPCLPEYSIRVGKTRILYIKMINQTENHYTIQFEDYITHQRQTCCIGRHLFHSVYDKETNNISWEAELSTSYEEFLTNDIPDMKWSDKEIQFWYDVFGIGPQDDPVLVNLPVLEQFTDILHEPAMETQHSHPVIIYQKEDADWLVKELKRIMNLDVIIMDSGKQILTKQKQKWLETLYPQWLTLIALVNLQFIKHHITVIKPDKPGYSMKLGNITVRTNNIIRTLLSQ